MERTLAIVKPDAVGRGFLGRIIARIEKEGFHIVALRMVRLTAGEAAGFYAVHRAQPFFGSLTAFVSSGPAVVLVLERDDAVRHWRDVMGPTDPAKAPSHTIRGEMGTNIERNAVHGSDAPQTAAAEVAFFFSGLDLAPAR